MSRCVTRDHENEWNGPGLKAYSSWRAQFSSLKAAAPSVQREFSGQIPCGDDRQKSKDKRSQYMSRCVIRDHENEWNGPGLKAYSFWRAQFSSLKAAAPSVQREFSGQIPCGDDRQKSKRR